MSYYNAPIIARISALGGTIGTYYDNARSRPSAA